MAAILYKWLLPVFVAFNPGPVHPVYVSVTQIEHNKKENILEVSCKLFTDDFEKTLRDTHKGKIDLLDTRQREKMYPLVNKYITDHLKLIVNGQNVSLKWIGYETVEDGIMSYLQVDEIHEVKTITVFNSLLYEYKSEQISLMHVTVNDERKSTKLNNPEQRADFIF